MKAQGAALGTVSTSASPLSGLNSCVAHVTQGCALGYHYHIPPLQGFPNHSAIAAIREFASSRNGD
jgi:hypothetical protein